MSRVITLRVDEIIEVLKSGKAPTLKMVALMHRAVANAPSLSIDAEFLFTTLHAKKER